MPRSMFGRGPKPLKLIHGYENILYVKVILTTFHHNDDFQHKHSSKECFFVYDETFLMTI